MKGSEKQIEWAKNILTKMEESAKEVKEIAPQYNDAIDKIITNAKNQEFATTIINSGKTEDGYTAPVNKIEWKYALQTLKEKGEI